MQWLLNYAPHSACCAGFDLDSAIRQFLSEMKMAACSQNHIFVPSTANLMNLVLVNTANKTGDMSFTGRVSLLGYCFLVVFLP